MPVAVKEIVPEDSAAGPPESVQAMVAERAFSPSDVSARESVAVRAARAVASQSPKTGATTAAGSTSVRQIIW